MQSSPNVCDSVREKMFLYRKLYGWVGKQWNIFNTKIYQGIDNVLLEALIVFLNPPSENLTNVMSNKTHYNMR